MTRASRTTPCGCSASSGMRMHLRALPKTNSTPGSIPTVEPLEWVDSIAHCLSIPVTVAVMVQLQLLGTMPSSRGVHCAFCPCCVAVIGAPFSTCLTRACCLAAMAMWCTQGPSGWCSSTWPFWASTSHPGRTWQTSCWTSRPVSTATVSTAVPKLNLGTTQYTCLGFWPRSRSCVGLV